MVVSLRVQHYFFKIELLIATTLICILFYKFQGITFKRVGVPTATDIIKASSKDAIRCVG